MLLGQRVPGCLHMRRLVIQDPPDRGGDPNKVRTAEFPGWEPYMTPASGDTWVVRKPLLVCVWVCVWVCVCVCVCVCTHMHRTREKLFPNLPSPGNTHANSETFPALSSSTPYPNPVPEKHSSAWSTQGKTSTTQTCKAQAEGQVNHEKQTGDLLA